MEIAKIETINVKVPFTFGQAAGGVPARTGATNNILMVKVQTDNGITGWGDAFCYNCTDAVKGAIHAMVAAWKWGAYLGEEGLAKGIRVKTSSYTRHHVNVSMVRAKASGYYINSILANQEVTADGYDEALLLDTEGFVAEGAGENLFIVKDGVLLAPPKNHLILPGITYDVVIELARANKLPLEIREISQEEVRNADEIWVTSSTKEVLAVTTLDGKAVGTGKPGPLFRRMHALYQEFKQTVMRRAA